MNDILAGSTRDLSFDPKTREYVPSDKSNTWPVFTIKSLNFWEAQEVLDSTKPAVDRIRRGLELGLTAIDGDADKAKQFVTRPKATMVNPLFDMIVEMASGN